MALTGDDDFCLLAEEKFDFDVSLSPASSKGDDEDVEDEVFLGPAGHKEKCISHNVNTHVKESVSSGPSLGEEPSWSPLLEENFEVIRKEAHLLASHIEKAVTNPVPEPVAASSNLPEDTEKFEAETSAKLGILSAPAHVLSPIKRETFCVQDSPMKQLPPAIQKRLQKVCSMSTGKTRLSTSSPVRHTDTKSKMAQRGRSLVSNSRVLPSRPTAMGNSRVPSCTRPAPQTKSNLPPPSKGHFGLKRSPGSRNTSRTGSTEDLLSDSASVTSDVSDSSFNTSLPARRGIPAPNKPELKGSSVRKVGPPPNRRVMDRSRNTSSSSSSVSSINSSLTVSPKGKLNSSLNTSVSSVTSRVPSCSSRLPSSTHKSGIINKPLESSLGKRTSLSTLGRKSSDPLVRPVKATPIKRPEPVPSVQHQTPAKKTMERTASVPCIPTIKTGSTVKVNSNLKTFVAPTPTNSQKGVSRSKVTSSPDVPRIMKPKRLMASCSVESELQRLAVPALQAPQTPTASFGKPMQSKLRRPSALPTPISRRVSGIPMLTPKSIPRLSRPSLSLDRLSPGSCSGMSHTSPGQIKQHEKEDVTEQVVPKEGSCAPAEFQPCSLVFTLGDDAETSAGSEPTVEESSSKPSSDVLEPHQPKPDSPTISKADEAQHNHQLHNTAAQEASEVLLVDAPAPAPVLKPEEKVLIDLSNTPDMIKTFPTKAFGGQLIDLSSPLIKWTPEKKEEKTTNEAPLINLSF